RGILAPMEAHHGVRISDQALVAAVTLSARYIPARQLPDKAVSLLDTAAARVAISQSATPAAVSDLRALMAALERELAAKRAEADLGDVDHERIAEIEAALTEKTEALAAAEADYERERALVDDILELRGKLAPAAGVPAPASDEDAAETPSPDSLRADLAARLSDLQAADPDRRMIHAHVDEQAVASVVSDWTGIPVGRMVTDELRAILTLPERLRERVIGQDHGLTMIARRIETNRARLDNPGKPIGVFMLCGPSGVGKTETALALAEAIYGGEQNVITINMSEFQEAHTVSALKGAPPGYVGYGEGGRLTEAVRRKPYSVVLLDEIEKAHPDVHELFFQVFDKGIMEDGTGRRIDFKNCVILLTSNVGTEVIMDMARSGETRPEPDELAEALRPHLQRVFPPALLGRIVTIPYFPLSDEVLTGIVKLKLGAIAGRMKSAHGAAMSWADDVVSHIVDRCNDPDSGGRMVDNIITNTILPDLARAVLTRRLDGVEFRTVSVGLGEDGFVYEFT
ncbi:MAG: AAA family ATPase, partial [Pararhodobacter sp.]